MKTASSLSLACLSAVLTVGQSAPAQSRPHFLTLTQLPAPVNVAGASSYSMALSADGLQAMVETVRLGGRGGRDLFLLQRPTPSSSFTSYGPMWFCEDHDEGGGVWGDPHVVLHGNRPGGAGGFDLYQAIGGALVPVAGLNSSGDDTEPAITGDGLEFFFTSTRPGSLGGKSLWRSTRASVNDVWSEPALLNGIDSANHEQSPSLTDDGLFLFFASNRTGNFDIYVAARATRQSPFGAPARVAELSGPNHDIGIRIAPQDAQALVTVVVNGRAVILAAGRDANPTTAPGGLLSASTDLAPGDLLTATLRAPAGHLGIVMLGAPMAPIEVGIGLLALHPAAPILVLDSGIQDSDRLRLLQIALPEDSRLHGVPIALQALSGLVPELRLTNPVLRTLL